MLLSQRTVEARSALTRLISDAYHRDSWYFDSFEGRKLGRKDELVRSWRWPRQGVVARPKGSHGSGESGELPCRSTDSAVTNNRSQHDSGGA